MTIFGNKAVGFDHPAQLPRDKDEHRSWQIANRDWWEAAPMRYDWRAELPQTPGTEDFFAEIDRRFLAAAKCFMPWRNLPFETVIPFDQLHDQDVLEIGVGHGTHAQLLAPRCKSFTGVDLTTAAVRMTAQRLRLFGLPGGVLQMDAENLAFPDGSFDFVWSWGVVHHAADTRRVLNEVYRVLRQGGACTVMVYYRSWWNYYAFGLLRGLLQGQWRSPHHVSQNATDGAIARYYKPDEWRAMTRGLFTVEAIEVYGLKSDIVPLPHGRLKDALMRLIPDAVARFLARHLRMGSLLVVQMRKPVSA